MILLCKIKSLANFWLLILIAGVVGVGAQNYRTEIALQSSVLIEIVNTSGKIAASASGAESPAILTATSSIPVSSEEIFVEDVKGKKRIVVRPSTASKRIDVSIILPVRSNTRLVTRDGEIAVSGNFGDVIAETETGTIATSLPTDDLRYHLQWTASRPRIVSDFDVENPRERSAGRFEIKGVYKAPELGTRRVVNNEVATENEGNGVSPPENETPQPINVRFTTARGIILLNVPPNEVASDLRERPLTEAAKAIVRSGDSVLMNAIRRAAPKYFGEYERTLPPVDRMPELSVRERPNTSGPTTAMALVRVTDNNNRAISGLEAGDFELLDSGRPVDIISVRPVTSHVNLVLLLDVSGSVDNYINFIRKAARSFVETVDPRDRVSIVLFAEDVKVLSGFTTDKARLSESLDTFDAGGATAYYDALAYTLADTLRPLRGERTAIVVLTDGDDNRSFLSFDSLAGAIEESGALIYPLYVPTGLIAASESRTVAENIDPLRNRHLTLSSKAAEEGPKLANMSGGVYYPITRLSQIQEAYEDIAVQLRTAYEIRFRSTRGIGESSASPGIRVRLKRTGVFATIESIASVPAP